VNGNSVNFAQDFKNMLQRIQTIYLLVAAIVLLPLFSFYFSGIEISEAQFIDLKIRKISSSTAGETQSLGIYYPLLVTFALCLFFPFFSIFNFKKRKFQLRLNGFAILTNTLLLAGMFYYTDLTIRNYASEMVKADYSWPISLPAVSIILLILANRSIKKDEALIRSVDRIR